MNKVVLEAADNNDPVFFCGNISTADTICRVDRMKINNTVIYYNYIIMCDYV